MYRVICCVFHYNSIWQTPTLWLQEVFFLSFSISSRTIIVHVDVFYWWPVQGRDPLLSCLQSAYAGRWWYRRRRRRRRPANRGQLQLSSFIITRYCRVAESFGMMTKQRCYSSVQKTVQCRCLELWEKFTNPFVFRLLYIVFWHCLHSKPSSFQIQLTPSLHQ